MFKKWLSVVLTVALLIGVAYPAVQVGAEAFSDRISVTATAGEKITIEKSATLPSEDDYDGILSLISGSYEIERDFAQSCSVTVTNRSDKNVEYYLNAQNIYSDIYMNFVRNGSAATPLVIEPGEVQTIKLDIFAQNAERGVYTIPVYAKIVSGDKETTDAKSTLTLLCEVARLDMDCKEMSSNESTLSKTLRLTNKGESLTDVTFSLSGEIADYVQLNPVVSNYQMKSGSYIDIQAMPDLAKIKNSNLTKIVGSLVIASGAQKETFALEFDTKGAEITSTTMGQLALMQSGNSFYNLEAVEGSETAELTVNGDNLSYSALSDFTYGEGEELGLGLEVEGRPYSGKIEDFEQTYEILEYSEDGYKIKTSVMVPNKELLDIIDNAIAAAQNGEELATLSVSDLEEYREVVHDTGVNYIFDYTIDVNNKIGLISDSMKQNVSNHMAGLSVATDVVDGATFIADPTKTTEEKILYGSLTVGTIVLTVAALALPGAGAGLILGLTSFGLNILKAAIKDNPYNANVTLDIDGYQCTNAGKISTDFYLNDYSGKSAINNRDSKMYVTSRMYGGDGVNRWYGDRDGTDYVDIADTTFTYSLNGVNIGESISSGVTDVAIAKLPADNLRYGKRNTLDCDYDTNPGHYFANTDTQITVTYPLDTPVCYIDTPESLQDVRSLPDFAVYSENIFGSDTDVVIGDKTESSVNIYNRGSFGGWFNIEIKAGHKVVYTEKNSYLDAFSGKTIDFEWTPYSEETDITVTLTNTSIGVDEKDDENNTASRTFKARNRIVPVITAESIGPKFVLEGEGIIFADVAKYNDVTKADFYIDGVLFEGEVKSAVDGDIMRFWINDPSITAGLREIKVVVTYKSGYDTVSTVTASKKINVLSSDWNRYNFILEDDFKNAKFYIYDIANDYYQKAGYSSHEGDNAAVGIDKDIFSKPDKYLLFVSSDNGFVYKSFADTDVELREATSSVLKIGETDDVYIKETKVKAFDGIETDVSLGSNYYLYFTDAVYTLELTYICYGREKTTEVTVDLNMDAEISLVDLADKFVFDFVQTPVSPVATVFYKNTSDASWSTFDLTEKFTGNVMTCFLTDGNIALIDGADEVFVQVVTEDSVFVTEVKPLGGTLKQPISLDKTKLQKYTLDLGDDELLNVKVVCDRFTVYLYKNVIYLQPAEYEITTNFKNGSVGTLSVDDSLSTAAASETAVVSVDWSGAYKAEKANVYGYGESGSDFAVYNYTCAAAIDAENDKYLVKTDIFRKNSTYTIESKADASNGKASVKIGDSFAGKITNTFGTYEGGSTVRIYLDKINDSYLNKLTYFNSKSASENFVGYLTLTNVADSSETYKIYVSLDNLSSFDVCLPNINGTYSVKLEVNASPAAEHKKVTDVTVSEKEIKLGLNETYKLSATVYPFDASDKRVTWVSQDTSIATVDSNGVVTASKFNSGSALISAVTVDGKISASCVVTVEYTMFQRILRTLFGELIFRFIMELIY